MCGLSHSLPQMIIGRIGQGFTGGAMIPTAQTIVRTRLPPHQMPIGMTLFGLIVLLGPAAGPRARRLAGGEHRLELVLLRQRAGGRGAHDAAVVWAAARASPRLARVCSRPTGSASSGSAVGLSSLTVVLEEGQRENWFDPSMIIWLDLRVARRDRELIALAIHARRAGRAACACCANRSYASVIFIVIVVGAVLYCVSYLLPQFLGIARATTRSSPGHHAALRPARLPDDADPAAHARQGRRTLMVIAGLLLLSAQLHARHQPDRAERRPAISLVADTARRQARCSP